MSIEAYRVNLGALELSVEHLGCDQFEELLGAVLLAVKDIEWVREAATFHLDIAQLTAVLKAEGKQRALLTQVEVLTGVVRAHQDGLVSLLGSMELIEAGINVDDMGIAARPAYHDALLECSEILREISGMSTLDLAIDERRYEAAQCELQLAEAYASAFAMSVFDGRQVADRCEIDGMNKWIRGRTMTKHEISTAASEYFRAAGRAKATTQSLLTPVTSEQR